MSDRYIDPEVILTALTGLPGKYYAKKLQTKVKYFTKNTLHFWVCILY